jgi:NADPH:quinone reductase-like Zn-dependent oxidoreductase
MSEQIPETMAAVLLTGHGGMDKLEYREDVPVPRAEAGEVLIRVAAAGVNNTDINTRVGWYSKRAAGDTDAAGDAGNAGVKIEDGSWSGVPMSFPRIQGADCCGHIVDVGEEVDRVRIGDRVLIRSCMLGYTDFRPFESCWLGSERHGAFAQYTLAPAADVFPVDCDWSDVELASIPCAYSTAEGLLHRSGVGEGDRVLVTGASGGVGSAVVQLARCRGAEVIAVSSSAKADWVKQVGAERVLDRDQDPAAELGRDSVCVVVDLIAGPGWTRLLDVLRRGGRYATAGAIAGPMVELDIRTLYLKDLTFYGCTWQEAAVFENLVGYIEQGRIRPLVSRTYPLRNIAQAQEDFIAKKYPGKLVLLPPEQR